MFFIVINMIFQNFIYSKIFDHYLILPMKTGTVHASWIFTYFDFYTYTRNFDSDGNFKEVPNPAMSAVHSYYIPPEIENPKIIVTTRNPYDKVLSRFLFTWTLNSTPTYQDFLNNILASIHHNNPMLIYPSELIPTYTIKLENMYEDYMRIPFIKDSNLNKTGILLEMCNKKINEARIKVKKEDFLTEETKELIYNFLKNQFELFGYEK